MSEKTYTVEFKAPEFLMVYSIILNIKHNLKPLFTDDKSYEAECRFSFYEKMGEKEIFDNVLLKLNSYRPRRLI